MTVTVGKATPTFSTWSNVSKNFGDSAFTVTAPTVTDLLPGSFTYTSATTYVRQRLWFNTYSCRCWHLGTLQQLLRRLIQPTTTVNS